MSYMEWNGYTQVPSRKYTCGSCGHLVGADQGYAGNGQRWIYICPGCGEPTAFVGTKQVPGPPFGVTVDNVPAEIRDIYEQARRCISVGAFTSVALTCRTLLMHIAVAQGAKADQSFAFYVNYFEENHLLPPKSKEWVDRIRATGGKAAHKLEAIPREDAETLITFCEMILKFLYEFPKRMTGKPS